MVTVACKCCGRAFDVKPSRVERGVGFCSMECRRATQYTGRFVRSDGYVAVRVGDSFVLEHRLVMEKHLGRILDKKEVVHHLNGVKDDNRIENLGLMKCLGQHVAIHFDAIAESDRLRQENEQLKSELQKYKDRFGELDGTGGDQA